MCKNTIMLDKNDLKEIENLIQKNVTNVLGEFFEQILSPYLDHEHEEVMKKFKENDEDHEQTFRKLDRNLEEHDEILEQLDSIEGKLKSQEKKIKKLEVLTAVS